MLQLLLSARKLEWSDFSCFTILLLLLKPKSIFSACNKTNVVLAVTPWTCIESHKRMNLIVSAWYPQLHFSLSHALTNAIFAYMHTYIHKHECMYVIQVQHLVCPNQIWGSLNSNSFCLQSFPIKSNNMVQNKRKKERQKREREEPALLNVYGAWTTSFLCVETNLSHYVSISCMSTLPQGLIFTKQTHHSFPQDENMVKYLL